MEKKKKMKNREDARTTLSKKLGKNSKPYRSTIRKFRDAALEKKAEYRTKYSNKLEHLKFKYREDEEEKLDTIPKEMQEYASLQQNVLINTHEGYVSSINSQVTRYCAFY